MTSRRAVSACLLAGLLLAAARVSAAQYPVPRERERAPMLDAAFRLFESAQWAEALEAFETAARESSGTLPAEALRRWGIAALEAGRPLTAYVRLRQCLAFPLPGPERDAALERAARARDAVLSEAGRFSRLVALAERAADEASAADRRLVRVAARDGDVSLEGMAGLDVDRPRWRRAEEIGLVPYLDLVRRLLDTRAVLDDPMAADATTGSRRAVLRLVVGEEERRVEAGRGAAYDRLAEAVEAVLEFARAVPALPPPPDPEDKAPAPLAKPVKKRR